MSKPKKRKKINLVGDVLESVLLGERTAVEKKQFVRKTDEELDSAHLFATISPSSRRQVLLEETGSDEAFEEETGISSYKNEVYVPPILNPSQLKEIEYEEDAKNLLCAGWYEFKEELRIELKKSTEMLAELSSVREDDATLWDTRGLVSN